MLRCQGIDTRALTETLPWQEPLAVAAVLTQDEACWALFYSGQPLKHTGRYSFLALYPQATVAGDDFAPFAECLSVDKSALDNAWFGYLGYELLHRLESLPQTPRGFIELPELWFTRFGLILCFDHQEKIITLRRDAHISPPVFSAMPASTTPAPNIASLRSPMTRAEYIDAVKATREAIRRGDFYQANITRKFTGEFSNEAHPLSLFLRLNLASPAAYSACIRMNGSAIISSSPERFLNIDADGHIDSRPIKGTTARRPDARQDAEARETLAASEKDRAENLMIVDLMRNDLARVSEAGSVKTERLFEISSYATLHHMASTVTARKCEDIPTLEAVKRCFPPGSMTGAPKIRAMEWCQAHEGIRRGVYSGALGWFGGDGTCDLSVVIRTIVTQGNRFEFQVGGGIVADSDPECEWRETMTKARGICDALGIETDMLERFNT